MARYTGPVCKLCRREGQKLFLKGERCMSSKCALERRAYPPGQHGWDQQFRRRRSTAYGQQLREKQKLRRVYGVLEKQFRRYYREAMRREGITGTNLLVLLESRLDNVIYRLGMATSRAQARQLVLHGHFDVNGHRCDIPSALLKEGDVVTVHPSSRQLSYFRQLREVMGEQAVPTWLSLDAVDGSARVVNMPSRDEIELAVDEQLVVEYYSR
ncbi:MAG: 30S ribosomal protein S4 [Anaerolineae bacterium]|nr:30S ribosomal protein S4 [Anaerolineae bacterium]